MRRSATRATDGVTFMVHQAVHADWAAQVQHTLDRHEVWDADGTLRTTLLRRHRLRWWLPDQLVGAVRDSGFAEVEAVGSDRDFVVYGRAG